MQRFPVSTHLTECLVLTWSNAGAALRKVSSIMLQEADVWPASIAGLPIAVPGTPAPGTYTLLLHPTNWLNKSSVSARTVTVTGLKPMIYINSNPERRIYSDQELQLVAVGTAGWCYIGGLRASGLSYLWTMTCLAGSPPLSLSPQSGARLRIVLSSTLTCNLFK